MISFVVLLATLFTLGECGPVDDSSKLPSMHVAGTGGPDPTPKPTQSPKIAGTTCGEYNEVNCSENNYDFKWMSSSPDDAKTESNCLRYCSRMAEEKGDGCCQYGGYIETHFGYNSGTGLCAFYVKGTQEAAGVKDVSGNIWKAAMCGVGSEADEATSFFASTSDGNGFNLAVNFCAAVGLVSVMYGAYKFYFGEKN